MGDDPLGSNTDSGLRVEVWVRDPSPPPDDPRRSVVSRLRTLERRGIVDRVSVRVWGRYAPLPDTKEDPDDPVRRRLLEFRAWAKRRGKRLEPAFQRVERGSLVSNASEEVYRLPLQCLAVYERGRLVDLSPCGTAEETDTVSDCLSRLEGGLLRERTRLE
jgi:hypothetical protein